MYSYVVCRGVMSVLGALIQRHVASCMTLYKYDDYYHYYFNFMRLSVLGTGGQTDGRTNRQKEYNVYCSLHETA